MERFVKFDFKNEKPIRNFELVLKMKKSWTKRSPDIYQKTPY